MEVFKYRRALVTSLACISLAACSLAPDYHRPQAPVPELYPGQDSAPTSQAELPPWREFFADPRLNALIELALQNNRDLRIAAGRVAEAQAQYGIADSDRYPTIGLQGAEQATHLPPNMRAGGPDAKAVNRSFTAGLGMLSFELDFFGRIRNLSESAYQEFLATAEARRTVQLALIAQTAAAYFNLRAAETLKDSTEQTLKARQGTLDLVQARFNVGMASDLDLAQAQSQVDVSRAQLVADERQLAQANNAMQLVIGTAIPADLPQAMEFGKGQLLASIPAGLPSMLLERRPDIIGAEHQLLAANAQIGAARAAFFPNISLTGLLGFASPELNALFGSSHRYWQFAPQINMPLFSGAVSGNLALAEARNNIAVANYEKTIQTAFREVADGLAGEATYGRQLDALRDTEKAALKTLELSQIRYETGVDSFLQVQTAQIGLYQVQRDFIMLGTNALLNRVELYKALGGGWSAQDDQPLPDTVTQDSM